MYFIAVIFCSIVPNFLALPVNETTPVNKPISRIIGGSDAPDGAYPYVVSLRTQGNSHFCGASIISPNWILTAAHCVYGQSTNDMIAVVGTNYLNSGGTAYSVARITPHDQYDPQNKYNDIALLRINRNITYSSKVQPIQLAIRDPDEDVDLVLSGWGRTAYPSDNPPNRLQQIILNTINLEECKNALLGLPVGAGHLCTYAGPGRGACNGDSGGPLARAGIQFGVASWGIPCARGKPDIFTSVAHYAPWITSVSGT